MNSGRCLFLFFFPFIVLPIGCDKGLEPPAQTVPRVFGVFEGRVTFTNWHAADSLYDLRLVAFINFPPSDIINDVLFGRAVVYPSLDANEPLAVRGEDSVNYSVEVPARTYPYVVVAQQFGPDVMTDWKPVGQYDLDSILTEPSSIVVAEGDTTRNVNISVDFTNPPPGP